jgi:hypothetical protein
LTRLAQSKGLTNAGSYVAVCWLVCASASARTAATAPTPAVVRREPSETVKKFLQRQRPPGATKLVHHTPRLVTLRGDALLIGVYRGSFDGKGNPCKGEWSNQFAFAFVRSKKRVYRRVPVTCLGDEGGSRKEVLAVFTARFDRSSPEEQLAFLTRWDSRQAGGRAAALRLGVEYDVKVMRFLHDPSLGFERLRWPLIDRLGGCDCAHLKWTGNKRTVVRVERAKARDVSGIRRQLRDLGIKPRAQALAAVAAGRARIAGFHSGANWKGGRHAPPSVAIAWKGSKDADHYPLADLGCAALYQRVWSRAVDRKLGSPPFVVSMEPGRLRHGRFTLVNDATTFCGRGTNRNRHDSLSLEKRLLSLVGPVVSYSVSEVESGGGGPRYGREYWIAIDLRRHKPAKLTALVDANDLLAALKRDSFLAPLFKKAHFTPRSVEDITHWAKKMSWPIALDSYAFHAFDARRRKAAMRIAFRDTTGGHLEQVRQIGVWVTPRDEALSSFTAACKGRGFTMSTARVAREF